MAKIYLTGALSGFDDPFAWMNKISENWSRHDFVNPYLLNDFELGDDEVYERPGEIVEPALDSVESVDGLLLRWDDDIFLVGSTMETKHAYEYDIPVVVWNKGSGRLSPWLLHMSLGHFDDKEKALKVLLASTGDMNDIL